MQAVEDVFRPYQLMGPGASSVRDLAEAVVLANRLVLGVDDQDPEEWTVDDTLDQYIWGWSPTAQRKMDRMREPNTPLGNLLQAIRDDLVETTTLQGRQPVREFIEQQEQLGRQPREVDPATNVPWWFYMLGGGRRRPGRRR